MRRRSTTSCNMRLSHDCLGSPFRLRPLGVASGVDTPPGFNRALPARHEGACEHERQHAHSNLRSRFFGIIPRQGKTQHRDSFVSTCPVFARRA